MNRLFLLAVFSLRAFCAAQSIETPVDDRTFEIRPTRSNAAEFPIRIRVQIRTLPGLTTVSREGATTLSGDKLVQRVSKLLSANAGSDTEGVVQSWAPSERDSIRGKYNDPVYRERNAAYANSATERYIVAELFYGGYSLALIAQRMKDGRLSPLILPFARINGDYFATNELESDGVYIFISRQIGQQLISEFLNRNPTLTSRSSKR